MAVLGLACATGLLGALAASGRIRSGLGYHDTGKRDRRVDFLRGVAIVFVVVDHLGIGTLYQAMSHESLGVLSGAELFVLLSGVVLGVVSRPRIEQGLFEAVDRSWARARKLYLWALIVPLVVYALSWLPALNTQVVTTFVDEGTGAAGEGAAGTIYSLFGGLERLFAYPADPSVVPQLLGLRYGPWQFNILGLYVVLLLVSPFLLGALKGHHTVAVIAGSLTLYAIGQVTHPHILPSQSEDGFPVLVWQVLFVLGLVGGYHRTEVIAWFKTIPGRVTLGACLILALALGVFAWGNTYVANDYDVRIALLPDDLYREIYSAWFQRTYLEPGRLLNVLVWTVSAYAVLSAFWRPLDRVMGWFLIPLGQATLYVFIVHVFLIIAVANIPALHENRLWTNTLGATVALVVTWTMVKSRFLFRLIPR